MKKLILLFYLMIFSSSFSQEFGENIFDVEIFNTYDDYVNKSGDVIGKYMGFVHIDLARDWRLEFKDKSGKDKQIQTRGLWGYRIGTKLFRMSKTSKGPLYVRYIGKYTYYELGILYLEELIDNVKWIMNKNRQLTYFSVGLNAKIIPQNKFLKQQKEEANQKDFCDCVKKAKKERSNEKYLNATYKCVKNKY